MPAHFDSRCIPFATAVSQRIVMVTVLALLDGSWEEGVSGCAWGRFLLLTTIRVRLLLFLLCRFIPAGIPLWL